MQRWLKFAKYLRDFGWEPIIYTPKNPDFELKDESLLRDVEGISVIKQPIWEPYSSYRFLLGKKAVQQQGVVTSGSGILSRVAVWIRGNFFIPDARVFWVRPSVNYLSRYLARNQVSVVVSTGPPHSVHLIGLELKKRMNIKWLADFRDPWSKWDVLDQLKLNKKARRTHINLERSVLKNADLVLATSPTTESSFKELGALNTKVITNGFDDEVIPTKVRSLDKFRISHIGLLNKGRNPAILWEVLNELCEGDNEFSNNLEIYLGGTIENEVIEFIESYGYLKDKVLNVGYRSHEDVMNDYASSALLLLLINNTNNAEWILPGKMFEYMAQKKPILALGKEDSDASRVFISAGLHPCVDYDNKGRVLELVQEAYRQYKAGETDAESRNISQFSRKELTKTLADCLDQLSNT